MNKFKAFSFILLVFLFINVLTGCGNNVTSAKEKTATSAEGKAAKSEITAKIQNAITYEKDREKKVGYLTREEFTDFSNDINILSYAMGSDSRIKINDDKEIENTLDTVKRNANQLTDEEALKAKKLMNSSKVIFKIAIQEDLKMAMNGIDVHNPDNDLHSFISNGSDQLTDANAITEKVNSTIDLMKSDDLYFLNNVKKETAKHANQFSKEERTSLNTTINNLTSSYNTQIAILESLKPVAVDDGTTPAEKLNSAATDYEDAKKNLADLEKSLGIDE